jgi:hypothetical protein
MDRHSGSCALPQGSALRAPRAVPQPLPSSRPCSDKSAGTSVPSLVWDSPRFGDPSAVWRPNANRARFFELTRSRHPFPPFEARKACSLWTWHPQPGYLPSSEPRERFRLFQLQAKIQLTLVSHNTLWYLKSPVRTVRHLHAGVVSRATIVILSHVPPPELNWGHVIHPALANV